MSFFFTLVFVLLVFWRPQEWLVPWLYGWPLLDGVMFLALAGLLVDVEQRRLRFPSEMPQIYLVGGIWVASCMSHVANTYLAGLLATIPLVFKSCFFTVVLMVVLDRSERLSWLTRLFVVMAMLMAVHAILQETRGYGFAGDTPIAVMGADGDWYTRSYFFGIFGDPNDLAQILVTALPFSFAMIRRKTVWNLLLGAACSWLLIRGVLTTHSRGGLLALAMTGSVMISLILPARMFPFLMTCVLLGGLAAAPLGAGLIGMDESAHNRVIFWGYANTAFKHHPLFGIGTNMFGELTNEESAAHNAYVLCYTETGFFGYWFWFGLIYLGMLGAWRTRKLLQVPTSKEEYWLKRIAGLSIAAMAGYLCSSYFLSRAFVYPMFFMFAILAAIPQIAKTLDRDEGPVRFFNLPKDLGFANTIIAALSIVYIYLSVIMLNKLPYLQ